MSIYIRRDTIMLDEKSRLTFSAENIKATLDRGLVHYCKIQKREKDIFQNFMSDYIRFFFFSSFESLLTAQTYCTNGDNIESVKCFTQ